MYGVRTVSVSLALAACVLWGATVYSLWETNQDRRSLALAQADQPRADEAKYKPVANHEAKSTLERADELAAAASKEFSKLTEGVTNGLADMTSDIPAIAVANAGEVKGAGEAKGDNGISVEVALAEINLPLRKESEPLDAKVDSSNVAAVDGAEITAENGRAVKDDAVSDEAVSGSDKIAVAETDADSDQDVGDKITAAKVKAENGIQLKEAVDDLKAIAGPDKATAETKIAEMTAQKLVRAVKETPTLNAPPWTVPFGADPDYDESTALRVGDRPWHVPTGVDPMYPKVSQKIAAIADEVSGSAADATETVGKKISSIASDVKTTIVGDKIWSVPDGNDPVYIDQMRLADNEGKWEIPTGVQPEYNQDGNLKTKDGTRLVHHGRADKLAFAYEDHDGNNRRIAYYDVAPSPEEIEVIDKIEVRLSDVKQEAVTAAPSAPEIIKDISRLPKDRVAVPVDKYEGQDAEEVTASITENVEEKNSEITGVKAAKIAAVKKTKKAKKTGSSDLMDAVDAELATLIAATPKIIEKPAKTAEPLKAKEEAPAKEVSPVKDVASEDKSSSKVAVAAAAKKKPVAENERAKASEIAVTKAPALLGKDEERLVNDGIKNADKKLAAGEAAAAPKDLIGEEAIDSKEADRQGVIETALLDNEKGAPDNKDQSTLRLADGGADLSSKDEASTGQVEENKKAPIWQVPDAADPQYGVVAQIERSFDHVKDVAVEAGDGIAKTVSKLSSNVKEAVAAPKRWSVPTGNVWGDKPETVTDSEIAVAALDVKSVDEADNTEAENAEAETDAAEVVKADQTLDKKTASEVTAGKKSGDKSSGELKADSSDVAVSEAGDKATQPDLPKLKGADVALVEPAVAAKDKKRDAIETADKRPEGKEQKVAALPEGSLPVIKNSIISGDEKKDTTSGEGEPKPFVSAKLQPIGVAPEINGERVAGLDPASDVKVEEPKNGVVTKLKNILALITDGDDKDLKPSDKPDVSRVDEVRFAAMKSLMLDQIDYKLISAKKGEGELSIQGRSQPLSRLSIYIDMTYLGDVDTDETGSWTITKSLYLPQGGHLVHAEHMSKGGLTLARKTMPFAQTKALKKPKGYKADTVGIGLGDKALAVMRDKLKADEAGGGSPLLSAKGMSPLASNAGGKISDVGTAVTKDLPLPVRKVSDIKGQHRLNDEDSADHIVVASISDDVARAGKGKKQKVSGLKNKASKSAADKTDDDKIASPDKTVKEEKPVAALKADADEGLKKDEVESQAKAVEVAVLDKDPAKESAALDDQADLKKSESETNGADKAAAVAEPELATTYVVKPGDTLSKIAQKVLGDSQKYKDILKLNPKLKSANFIYPKQKLIVREGAELAEKAEPVNPQSIKVNEKKAAIDIDKANEKQKTEKSVAKIDDSKKSASDKDEAETEFYIVQAGDNLWKIAQRVYGNGGRYKDIIKLNPGLTKNPSMIKPKVKLRVKAA
ncbi:MAG: hypothetical protein DHS20C08_08070 [Rhodomicrobium sp.]|nr:MAG: hypothetical protein DHS20C08_08070 [Rhodomicrobium sp.]